MDIGLETLSKITTFSKYARFIKECNRREDWQEIVDRYENMLVKKYPDLKQKIYQYISFIRERKVLPSMRAMQFAGSAMEVNNARGYNCAYLHVDSIYAFSETMFLLLGGSGVGYSVQKHHIALLPLIRKPQGHKRYLIEDSIMGWADAVKMLLKAYTSGGERPIFDFRALREKGAELITAGGKAPGPEPLRICLEKLEAILRNKEQNSRFSTLECHDMLCHIANSVLAGGIRRSAMIALFSMDDLSMINCKTGSWWLNNEQRGRANNSAVLVRGEVTKEQFMTLWGHIKDSGCGEPGIYWTNDKNWGTNPCCEIALNSNQFCNLCEINGSDIVSQDDFNERAIAAAFFGTLQAGFTDFHYLRPIWEETTKRESLLGIGITGIASGAIFDLNEEEACDYALDMNGYIAQLIGIPPAARAMCIKPSGTTSCVLGSSSGIHDWFARFFLRTLRFSLDESIAQYLLKTVPEICELDKLRADTLCVRIPIKAPERAVVRSSAIELLERVKRYSLNWVKPGHREGQNTHNVSATVFIKDYEWEEVSEWMWNNQDVYNGLSVLPYDGGSYIQAPFEEIDENTYYEKIKHIQSIDLNNVHEGDDNVDFGSIAACAGGACDVAA